MTPSVLAALLLAAALVVAPATARPRRRLSTRSRHPARGVPRALGSGWSARWASSRAVTGSEPLALAGAWELLAACLRAGMAVPQAIRAVAEGLEAPAGPALRRTADLLALGADHAQAWQPAVECVATERLAAAARRSARSGAALAELLSRLGAEERAGAREQSEARAQRAGVLIAAPLGLCFLPAFLALGVVPVLIGLATGVLSQQ
ncbi:MAG: type II secretion system F family protein [Pseudonocardiaceae bacterium]